MRLVMIAFTIVAMLVAWQVHRYAGKPVWVAPATVPKSYVFGESYQTDPFGRPRAEMEAERQSNQARARRLEWLAAGIAGIGVVSLGGVFIPRKRGG
jgi:hypothetical protein